VPKRYQFLRQPMNDTFGSTIQFRWYCLGQGRNLGDLHVDWLRLEDPLRAAI
jgi:hypothetical protein